MGGNPHVYGRAVRPVQVAPGPEGPRAADEQGIVAMVAVPAVAELRAPDDEGVVHHRAAARVGYRLQSLDEPRDLPRVVPHVVGHRDVLGRVVVDVVGDALVDLVADVVAAELRGRHLAERKGNHPRDVATERRGDDVREGVEAPVVLLECGGRPCRGVAGKRRQAFQPPAEPVDEPEMRFDSCPIDGIETARQRAVLAVREVERRPPAHAHRIAGGGRSEDPFPGAQRRVLGRQAYAALVVGDGTARLERGVHRQLQRREPVGPRDARGDELVQRRRSRPRVTGGEVGSVAGPGVDPPAVVAVAAGVELRRRQRQPVEDEQAMPVGVQRRQRRAPLVLRQRRQVERPGLRFGHPRRAHPPGGVRPSVAVTDHHEPPGGRRGLGKGP